MFCNTYDYLYVRVEYPAERGYRMEPRPLPSWIYVTITRGKNNKYLTVYSRIHVDKNKRVGPTYSLDYSDEEVLKNLSGEIYSRYL